MEAYDFPGALDILWKRLREQDERMSARTPWKMPVGDEQRAVLTAIAQQIFAVAHLLQPFMPATAAKVIKQFGAEKIAKGDSLFPRLEKYPSSWSESCNQGEAIGSRSIKYDGMLRSSDYRRLSMTT